MIVLNWLFTLWLALLPAAPAYTLSTLYASAAANDSSYGTIAWADTSNATGTADSAAATATTSTNGAISNYLKASSYGFAIPGGSTINGVQVTIRSVGIPFGSGSVAWNRIRLIDASGTIGTADKATSTLSTVYSTPSFGGSADTWSGEASSIDWNNNAAGVAIAVSFGGINNITIANIDYVQVAITYTEGSAVPASPRRTVIGQARDLEFIKQGASF